MLRSARKGGDADQAGTEVAKTYTSTCLQRRGKPVRSQASELKVAAIGELDCARARPPRDVRDRVHLLHVEQPTHQRQAQEVAIALLNWMRKCRTQARSSIARRYGRHTRE